MSECEKDLRRAAKEIENEFPVVAQVCRESANFVGMVIKQSKSDAGIADTLRARVQELEANHAEIEESLPFLYAGVQQMEGRMGEAAYLDLLIHLNRIQEAITPPEDSSDAL